MILNFAQTGLSNWLNSQGSRSFIIPATFSDFTSSLSRTGLIYRTDYNFDAIPDSIGGSTAYIDPSAGDTGVGTIGDPFDNSQIVTAFNNVAFTTYLFKAGTRAKLPSGITVSREVKIGVYGQTSETDYAEVTSQIDVTWTAHASYANVWQANNAQTALSIGSVFDESNLDTNGLFKALTPRTTVELVRDNANSFFYDATADIVYVRTFDNRQPDSDVCCLLSSTTLRLFRFNQNHTANTKISMSNIRVYGANPLVLNNTSTSFYWNYAFENCHFSYAGNTNGITMAGYGVGHFKNCASDYNLNDGFNYSNSVGFAFEWYCRSWNNNLVSSDANNGSTSHLGWKVIRVGGDYQFCAGKGVQDINDTKSYSLGCTSKNSTALNTAHKAGFATNSATGTSESWWIECTGPTDANKFWLFNNSTAHVYDGEIGNLLTGTNQQDPGGVLDELEESEVYL